MVAQTKMSLEDKLEELPERVRKTVEICAPNYRTERRAWELARSIADCAYLLPSAAESELRQFLDVMEEFADDNNIVRLLSEETYLVTAFNREKLSYLLETYQDPSFRQIREYSDKHGILASILDYVRRAIVDSPSPCEGKRKGLIFLERLEQATVQCVNDIRLLCDTNEYNVCIRDSGITDSYSNLMESLWNPNNRITIKEAQEMRVEQRIDDERKYMLTVCYASGYGTLLVDLHIGDWKVRQRPNMYDCFRQPIYFVLQFITATGEEYSAQISVKGVIEQQEGFDAAASDQEIVQRTLSMLMGREITLPQPRQLQQAVQR